MKKLRIGIVGLGRVASKTHIPVLESIENVEVVAGAERNSDRAERVKTLFAIKRVYSDYAEMCASEKLEGVYVCLPNYLHKDACKKALENGVHVLCEKPMGISVEEAQEITAIAEEKGLVLMPGYKKRYAKNFAKAKKIIEDGVLGKIIHVQGTFLTPGPYISWDPKSDWYLDERWYGVIYDSACHLVDILLFLIPFKIIDIKVLTHEGFRGYNVPTNLTCIFKMEDGIIGDLSLGWRASTDILSISVHGTAGSLTTSREQFYYINSGTDPVDKIKIHIENALAEFSSLRRKVRDKIRGKDFYIEDLIQARAFCNAILGIRKPPLDGQSAIRVHEVLSKMIHL